jgi:hypothetical protein
VRVIDLGNEGLDRLGARHIKFEAPPGAPVGDLFNPVEPARPDNDVEAVLGQPHGRGCSNAARSTGNYRCSIPRASHATMSQP